MVRIFPCTARIMRSPTPNDNDEYCGVHSSWVSCSFALVTDLAADLTAFSPLVPLDHFWSAQEDLHHVDLQSFATDAACHRR